MVDTLIESQANVELLLQFFDIFLKMKGLTTSEAFQEFDTNKDGFISPKEFRRAMEAQKMYTRYKTFLCLHRHSSVFFFLVKILITY